MSNDSQWMSFYMGDYVRDTGHLSTLEHGAYILLLIHYWSTRKPLPDNDNQLAVIARMAPKEWSKVRDTLRAFFVAEGGVLRQKRADSEIAKAASISSKRRTSAHASWEHRRSTSNANASASAEQAHMQSTHFAYDSTSTSTGIKKEVSKPRARATPEQQQANGRMPRWPDHPALQPYAGTMVENHGRPHVNFTFVDGLFEVACEAAGIDPSKNPADWRPVVEWLAAGFSERQILEAIRTVASRDAYRPPRSLAYFDKAVRSVAPEDEAVAVPKLTLAVSA